MALINYYNSRGAGGDLPLNGKTMIFTTTAATEPGDFLYYTSATAETVTPFSSGSTTGLCFVGVAKTSASANTTVTAYVDSNFTGKSWHTVWSGTWSGSVSSSSGSTFSKDNVTLKSGSPLRITGSVSATYGASSSFSAKEISSSGTQIHYQTGTGSTSQGSSSGYTSQASATFSGSTLSFSGSSKMGTPCGTTQGSCTINLTKIEQYY